MKNIFVGTLPGIVLLLFAVLFGKGTYIHIYILKKIPRHSWHDRALPKNPQTVSAKMFFLEKRFQRATAYIHRHING